jgi:3-hydroxyacyl-[acyl-carrier-protein] dehydratase
MPDLDLDALIPHRGRWRFVQRLISVEGPSAIGDAHFDETFAEGHFPERAVVPGVVLLEGLAQTMLALSRTLAPVEGTPFLAGFDKVRFRAPVFPPATVRFEVRITGERGGLTSADGTATVDGQRVCTAKLIGAVLPHPAA